MMPEEYLGKTGQFVQVYELYDYYFRVYFLKREDAEFALKIAFKGLVGPSPCFGVLFADGALVVDAQADGVGRGGGLVVTSLTTREQVVASYRDQFVENLEPEQQEALGL